MDYPSKSIESIVDGKPVVFTPLSLEEVGSLSKGTLIAIYDATNLLLKFGQFEEVNQTRIWAHFQETSQKTSFKNPYKSQLTHTSEVVFLINELIDNDSYTIE